MYSDNGGCYGGIGLLVLLIFFAMFANNGGDGGIFGNGGNRSASTAAATDALTQQSKYEALQNENKSLKAALALKDANCARDAQTDRIIDAVQGRSCCNTYQQESIHVLHRIAEGISGLQASQTAQSATLAQILAKVNEPATTTTPAA